MFLGCSTPRRFLPLVLVMGFHPGRDSDEVSVVVSDKDPLFLKPVNTSNAPHFVSSVINILPVVHTVLVLPSFEVNFVHVKILLASSHLKDQVKV